LTKLIPVQHSANKKDAGGTLCDSCGRTFEDPIHLTNLSGVTAQNYDACPFCFSRVEESPVLQKIDDLRKSISESSITFPEDLSKKPESPGQDECPHHFGYLRKRPKNAPIPESCLTCKKMIQCLLT